VERPVEVVVAAAVEGAHAIDRVRLLRAEQDHRHLTVPLPQPAAELESLGISDQDEIWAEALEELERFSVRNAHDFEPVLRQMTFEEASRGVLRLCEQHCTRHAIDASGDLREAPDVLSVESVSKNRQHAERAVADQIRPERNTPHRSQSPSTPERKNPNADTTLSPSTCGPDFANTPIRLEPTSPAATTML